MLRDDSKDIFLDDEKSPDETLWWDVSESAQVAYTLRFTPLAVSLGSGCCLSC